MDFNGFKITELPIPGKGDLIFTKTMEKHPFLGPLGRLSMKGEIPVLISGFCDTPRGRILEFSPKKMPGIKRYALRKFFNLDNPSDF